jgi:anti-sigma factor RsiW
MTQPNLGHPFLGAYVDNELGLGAALEVEEHLRGCAECRAEVAELRALHQTAQAHLTHFVPPAGMEKRLRQAIRPPTRPRWSWFAVAAMSVALAAVTTPLLLRPTDSLREEILDAHARSLLADHATDVASSDRHTVKPWFQGKVDFGVPAASFDDAGFPLVGGRLDYLDKRPVAALVYRRRNHLINAFVWPQGTDAASKAFTERGYAVRHWARAGLAWWLVSDAAPDDLSALETLLDNAP